MPCFYLMSPLLWILYKFRIDIFIRSIRTLLSPILYSSNFSIWPNFYSTQILNISAQTSTRGHGHGSREQRGAGRGAVVPSNRHRPRRNHGQADHTGVHRTAADEDGPKAGRILIYQSSSMNEDSSSFSRNKYSPRHRGPDRGIRLLHVFLPGRIHPCDRQL